MSITSKLQRLSLGIAAVCAVAALTAPVGLAATAGPDGWYGYAVSLTAQDNAQRFITDTLGGTGRPVQAPAMRFVTDTLAPGGGGGVAPSAATGFDWADAGIGAAGTAAAVLLMAGGSILVARRRRHLAF